MTTLDHTLEGCRDLSGEETDYGVNGPSCALHGAMRDIPRCNRSVLRNIFGGHRRVSRHVPRGASRTRLNAANANSQREND